LKRNVPNVQCVDHPDQCIGILSYYEDSNERARAEQVLANYKSARVAAVRSAAQNTLNEGLGTRLDIPFMPDNLRDRLIVELQATVDELAENAGKYLYDEYSQIALDIVGSTIHGKFDSSVLEYQLPPVPQN
jgi:hypothetical protein